MRRAVLLLSVLALALTFAPAAGAQTAAPNDPLWSAQWGPRQIHADQAWGASTGAGAVIAVVDSGVDLSHPDLQGQLVNGATFVGCAANGPCGNGDYTSGKDAGEPDGHGTHVAGIAAAATGNGIGVAGVAPDAKIMPVKVLGEEGGSFEEIAAGIRWATDNGADVINMSLGGLPGLQVLEITGVVREARDAIAYANSKGVAVVVASGNESAPLCASPSFNNGALCVGATDPNELKAWYSNLTVKPDLLTISAPGGAGTFFCEDDVVSTVPRGLEGFCGADGYDYYAGTSMAAPHVSGVAALLSALGLDNTGIYDVLTATARQPVTGLRGVYDPAYGYGIVDAAAAVAAAGSSAPAVEEPTAEEPAKASPGKGSGRGNSNAGGPKKSR